MYGKIQEMQYTRVWFDRFLIDRKYQGKGYGLPAVKAVLHTIQSQYPDWDIYLSVYEDNKTATALYLKLGFEFNGESDINGEKVMMLKRGIKIALPD